MKFEGAMYIIDCVSDLHGYKPTLKGGDILILAGDYTAEDSLAEWQDFESWLMAQDYKYKVIIAGNHDGEISKKWDAPIYYLENSGIEIMGFKIWGTPWTPWLSGVDPSCKYFMASENQIRKKFNRIPNDLDILITHSPMRGILDENSYGEECGSLCLADAINRTWPDVHVFGHIHEQRGKARTYNPTGTLCVNCSYVDNGYQANKGAIARMFKSPKANSKVEESGVSLVFDRDTRRAL